MPGFFLCRDLEYLFIKGDLYNRLNCKTVQRIIEQISLRRATYIQGIRHV